MFSKKISEVKNPIIYIFLAMITSSVCYGLNSDFKELAFLIASFFFISVLYYCGINFTGAVTIFFVIELVLNIIYYDIPKEIDGILRISKVTQYSITASYNGKNVLVQYEGDNNFENGERYRIKGCVVRDQDRSKGVAGTIKVDNVEVLEGDFITKIQRIRKKIYGLLKENLGARKAGLISSIAFGYSDYLDKEDKEDMKKFGVIHSISVSGLHVVIVYVFIKKILGSKLGIIGTLVYVVFTGCPYSSIRAFIMLTSIEMGKILKRNNNSLSALSLSGIILLINKPYCIFEISFDLSYLATLGILLYNKKLNYYLYKIPDKIRESLSITLCAQVFTLPYIIYTFRDFSLNFILGNIVLVPFVNIIVITGNLLPLVCIFPKVFDFISYIDLKILKIFDYSIDKLDNFTLPCLYGNEYIVSFYLFTIISFYFFIKGHKKFIYLPAIYIFIIMIQIYSPFFKIQYYNEGAIALSYRGERVLISNKSEIDMERLAKVAMADTVYRNKNLIEVNNICKIKSKGQDYILYTCGGKYLLKMTWSKKYDKEYDIISFKDGAVKSIFIIDGKIISGYV